MKKIKKIKSSHLFILLICLFTSFLSCSKEDVKPSGGAEEPSGKLEHVNSAFVIFDENNVSVQKCDTLAGQYEVTFKKNIPEVKAGSVVIVSDESTDYIVLVVKATTSGNTIIMEGELGDLSYIFSGTELTLITEGNAKASLGTGKNVHYPINVNGTRANWDIPLWSSSQTTNVDIYNKDNAKLWTEARISEDLNASMILNFGEPITTEICGIKFARAKNFDVDFSVSGDFEASFDIFFKATGKGRIDLDPKHDEKLALLKHNLLPQKDLYFLVFDVVPVKVEVGCDLFGEVDLNYDAELDFTTGIEATASGTIGLAYDGSKNDNPRMYNKMAFEFNKHDPMLEGRAEIDGKVHIFPRIHAWLYGIVGPSVDIKPYAKTSIGGSFGKSIGDNTKDYLASSVKTFAGLDLAVGISRGRMRYEVWNKSTPDLNLAEFKLYESPVNIKLKEGKKNDDGTIDVSFEVFDRGFDDKEVLSPLWPIVKFEAEGELDERFKVAEAGIVTVKWKPKNRPSKLYAKIYSIDGAVLAQAEYQCEMDICGKWYCSFEELFRWVFETIGPNGVDIEEHSQMVPLTFYLSFNEDGTGEGTFGVKVATDKTAWVEEYYGSSFVYSFSPQTKEIYMTNLKLEELPNIDSLTGTLIDDNTISIGDKLFHRE